MVSAWQEGVQNRQGAIQLDELHLPIPNIRSNGQRPETGSDRHGHFLQSGGRLAPTT